MPALLDRCLEHRKTLHAQNFKSACILVGFTPLKTKMTNRKIPMSNWKYIFIHGGFFHCHVSFLRARGTL